MSLRYSDAVARSLGLGTTPRLITRSLQGLQIAATHIVCGPEQIGMTKPIPPEDTFAVGINFTYVPYLELWRKGRLVLQGGFVENSLRITHLIDEVSIHVFKPSDSVIFHIPRAALNEIADEEGFHRIETLSCLPGIVDPTLAELARVFRLSFDQTQEASPIFVDQVMIAVCSHLIKRYGDNITLAEAKKTYVFSSAQMLRAEEMLAANLKGDLRLSDIARESGISQQYLITEFKRKYGSTPFQWLLQRRVDRVKELLRDTTMPIYKIAPLCGFRDHSHLTGIFTRLEGIPPTTWRQRYELASGKRTP